MGVLGEGITRDVNVVIKFLLKYIPHKSIVIFLAFFFLGGGACNPFKRLSLSSLVFRVKRLLHIKIMG